MKKRVCIFCGRTPLTREHILPGWIEEIHRRDPRGLSKGAPNIRRVRAPREPDSIQELRSAKLYPLAAKCVCAKCNNTWMSDIEGRAKRFLEPMVEGKEVELNAEAQVTIATWACLKTIVGFYAYKTLAPLPDDWLAHLFKHHTPPDTWFIFATAYSGDTTMRFESSEVGLSAPRDPKGTPPDHGVITSLIVGYLAFKVFGVRRGTPYQPGADGAFRIWPASPLILLWPPPLYVDDGVIDAFLDWGIARIESPAQALE